MAPTRRRAAEGRTRERSRVAVLAGTALIILGGYVVWNLAEGGPSAATRSCSWPLRVRGHASREQAGLIRCYLQALAHHDRGGLLTIAYTTNGPVRITARDLRHAADARTGPAAATFTPGGDDAYAVTIVFADHARETVAMGLGDPGSAQPWRLGIGTLTVPNSGPPPTRPSP